VAAVSRDPKDDVFLATAKAGHATYLVTEDNDLLVLGSYEGTRIVDAATFLRLLETATG
jgi:predicted nucleic acid-binding protein